jgi:very-short-patch-repair endonuclease
MSRLLKAMNHKPKVRGGNGTGMTKAEKMVSLVLGPHWVWNFPVALGKRQQGYPTNYKLDFANPTMKVGLEVDGNSHHMKSRKEQDEKKTLRIALLGWKVFRISNQQALSLCTTSKLKEHLTTLLGAAF